MKKGVLVIAFVLSITAFSNAQSDRTYTASRVALYAGTALDLISTQAKTGKCKTVFDIGYGPYCIAVYHEANGIVPQSGLRRVALLGTLAISQDIVTHHFFTHGHRKLALGLNFAVGVEHGIVATWNFHLPIESFAK